MRAFETSNQQKKIESLLQIQTPEQELLLGGEKNKTDQDTLPTI
jgi:hypothetical protein